MLSIKNSKQALLLTMTLFLGIIIPTQVNADHDYDCTAVCEANGEYSYSYGRGLAPPDFPADALDDDESSNYEWSNNVPNEGLPLGTHTVNWELFSEGEDDPVYTEEKTYEIVDTTAPYLESEYIYAPAVDFLTTLTPELLKGGFELYDAVDSDPTATLLGAVDDHDYCDNKYMDRVAKNKVAKNIEPEFTLKVRTGMHVVAWETQDASGNSRITCQGVTIIPVATMMQSPMAVIGGEATITINLNGELVDDYYYFRRDESMPDEARRAKGNMSTPPSPGKQASFLIELSGTAFEKIETNRVPRPASIQRAARVLDNSLVITLQENETLGSLTYEIPDDVGINSNDTLIATIVDTYGLVEVGEVNTTNIPLTDQNIAPRFELSSFLDASSGHIKGTRFPKASTDPVVIYTSVFDEGTTTYKWEVNGAQFSRDGEWNISLIPTQATSNIVTVTLTATDTDGLATTKSLDIVLTDNQPQALSANADTDGDGDDDMLEGYGDSDGDGIADYLDNDPHVNQLPLGDNNDPMFVKPGITLTLGSTKRSADSYTAADATVSDDNLQNHADAGGNAPNNTNDSDHPVANRISPVIDFEVSGFVAGETIDIVIPLPDGVSIPENAVYRKYTAANGWKGFVYNSNNSIASAPRITNNTCPAPDSNDYRNGLGVSDECIRLSIEDGGPNDADGIVNGVIVDPGVLTVPVVAPVVAPAVPAVTTTTTTITTTSGGGGGGGGGTGLIMLLLLPLAVFRMTKLKNSV
jgi:hypothetical protein